MKTPKKSDGKDDSVSDAATTTTSTAPPADAGGASQSPPSPYAIGDIVLAWHNGRLYEAKGWKNRVKKQKKNPSLARDKRKRDDDMDKGKDSVPSEKLVNIPIPPTLKKQLMDDFESINQMGKLVKLPRTPNVDDILEKYRDYRGKKDDVMPPSVGEVLSGLLVYFNKALPVMLLYNKEREQYQEAIIDNISPSAIYGAEHLLRLLVKLPALLYELNIEEETLRELQQILHDFLKFLQKNQGVFFLSTYHVPEALEGGTDKDCN